MNRRVIIACFAAAVACRAVAAVPKPDAPKPNMPKPDVRRPNVLLVVSDDQRRDTIAALGNTVIRTPVLDRLVAQGLAFTRAIAPDPLCVPSRAEILTGASEFRNGVTADGGKLRPGLVFWGDQMRRHGYRAWYVGKWMNDGRPITRGYDETLGLFASAGFPLTYATDYRGLAVTGYRGWCFQTDDGRKMPEQGVGLTPDISRTIADSAIQLIERKTDRPFFLHVNFTAPHDPLLLPPGYERAYQPAQIPLPPSFLPRHPFDHGNIDGRDERLLPWPRTAALVRADLAAYYAVISHMDEQVGRILAALEATGQKDNTIVIFTSDNGLAMGSHGLRGKQNMYEHGVGVPLVMAGPGIPRGQRTAALCQLRDLYPTVCELVGIDTPGSVEGRSMAAVIRGQAKDVYPHVFGYFRDTQRMVSTADWKLIYYPHLEKYQLFDLRRDPYELADRAGDPQAAAVENRLRQLLLTRHPALAATAR